MYSISKAPNTEHNTWQRNTIRVVTNITNVSKIIIIMLIDPKRDQERGRDIQSNTKGI